VLLDIDMPGLDGLAAAEEPGPPVVHDRHWRTLRTRSRRTRWTICLPITQERLERALRRSRHASGRAPRPWRLVVSDGSLRVSGRARWLLPPIKGVSLRWRGRELLLRESLDALEARLALFGFLRPNRGRSCVATR
jgi:DNA-binding LytR/AlgR family response regulator